MVGCGELLITTMRSLFSLSSCEVSVVTKKKTRAAVLSVNETLMTEGLDLSQL